MEQRSEDLGQTHQQCAAAVLGRRGRRRWGPPAGRETAWWPAPQRLCWGGCPSPLQWPTASWVSPAAGFCGLCVSASARDLFVQACKTLLCQVPDTFAAALLACHPLPAHRALERCRWEKASCTALGCPVCTGTERNAVGVHPYWSAVHMLVGLLMLGVGCRPRHIQQWRAPAMSLRGWTRGRKLSGRRPPWMG